MCMRHTALTVRRKRRRKLKIQQEKRKEEEKIKLYKYVGESCRSVWERSAEHLADLKNLNPTSHLLKHIIDKHEGGR